MRILVIVAAILALASPALSQGMRGGKHRGAEQKTDTKNKANEKDYKDALDRVPTPTQKYDPWGNLLPSGDKH